LVLNREVRIEEKVKDEGLLKKADKEGETIPIETIRTRITTEWLTGKESPEYQAAVIGDEVGDPMKATSGPAIAVLMKQMCIISLIFGQFFTSVAIFHAT
jgi:hypothetical protein